MRQLGHADWSVTARHYARWTGGDQYVEPERLRPGEVPADLLARFVAGPRELHRPHLIRVTVASVGTDVIPSSPQRRERDSA